MGPVTCINHVSVNAKDLAASVEFRLERRVSAEASSGRLRRHSTVIVEVLTA
ncbi:MAG: hypothetical protein ABI611_09515 [Solirubrobacteraceae bacterium]